MSFGEGFAIELDQDNQSFFSTLEDRRILVLQRPAGSNLRCPARFGLTVSLRNLAAADPVIVVFTVADVTFALGVGVKAEMLVTAEFGSDL